MLIVMKERVTQCNSVAHWCVFNSFWTQRNISGFDTHTQYLTVGSIDCRIWSFHGISWQKEKYRILPVLSFNLANMSSKELHLWLHPIRLNSTNEIFSSCGAALHQLMFVKPKLQLSISAEATVQTTDQTELLSDGDMMKHRATLTHIHTHTAGTMQTYCSLPVENQEKAAHADPGSVIREQCHNTFSVDWPQAHKNEEMRIGWAVMTLPWHATWKTGIWHTEQASYLHAVYTNTYQRHTVFWSR